MKSKRPVVGLSGGIGSGKSAVARILAELGAAVINSDDLNRQELEEQEVRDTLASWWGPDVLGPDGRIDRAAVARIVFADETQRHRLEGLMHPRIERRRAALTAQYELDPRIRLIVIDAPLLYEAGLDRQCDAVIFVDAPRELRLARVRETRGWTDAELNRREKFQQPLEMKRARANYTCTNNSNLDDLRRQVESIFSRIVASSELIV